MLPVWSHYANENWCMIGYHAVPVIADAMVKNIAGFDYNRALQASLNTANNDFYEGLGTYKAMGFVPEDISGSSVSKTLEYSYDDYCVLQMARYLKNDFITGKFELRATNYKNVFDAQLGFMHPKLSSGKFYLPFDPLDTHQAGFIEGNAWNYSLYVPQDPRGMIKLMGGEQKFMRHLDSLFTMNLPAKYYEKTEDIMKEGLIGNYVHGNEPSHHVPYLYNYTNQYWKTQEKTRMILPNQYNASVDGLSGNDDCGQMSAWYVFSALGFYPVCPGSNEYAVTSPLVSSAKINLENGKVIEVKTKNQGVKNVYIQKISWNNIPLASPFITYDMIVNGGVLYVELGPKPNKTLFKNK
jgi:predicted alpha-1,2-mannosidase